MIILCDNMIPFYLCILLTLSNQINQSINQSINRRDALWLLFLREFLFSRSVSIEGSFYFWNWHFGWRWSGYLRLPHFVPHCILLNEKNKCLNTIKSSDGQTYCIFTTSVSLNKRQNISPKLHYKIWKSSFCTFSSGKTFENTVNTCVLSSNILLDKGRRAERSIYGLYKNQPLFSAIWIFSKTKNNSRFYVLKLFFSSYDNRFSCLITILLHISLQSCCILFKYGKVDVFGQIGAYICLVSIERGRGQD